MTSAVLDRKREIIADEERDYDERLAMARCLADGKELSASHAARLRKMSRPEIESLTKKSDGLKRRDGLLAQLDADGAAVTREREARSAIERLDAEFKAMQERYAAAVREQQSKIEAALDVRKAAAEARRQLQAPSNVVDRRVRERL